MNNIYPIADVAEEAVVLIFDVDTVLVNVRRLDVLAVSRFFWFVCKGFNVPLIIFHSYREVIITDKGLQMLTYARHSWSLSSEVL